MSPLLPLEQWFLATKRSFPWRIEPTPYAVLVSEVMLQQTQASRVIEYFTRWMGKYPTLKALSIATDEEVMKLWEGLGYYSRARSLLKAARYIVDKLNGVFPESEEELLKIPGIGPYTAGAILSFAFHKHAAAVDANVLRVLSRLFMYEDRVDQQASRTEISKKLLHILPKENPHIVMEGLIELGAVVCKKVPVCALCPIQESCAAFQKEAALDYPKKKAPDKRINLFRLVFVLEKDGKFLVVKRPPGGIMAGLYEFPFVELDEEFGDLHLKMQVSKYIPSFSAIYPLAETKHSFTRYLAKLYPFHVRVTEDIPQFTGIWKSKEELLEIAFSSGHKKIVDSFGII